MDEQNPPVIIEEKRGFFERFDPRSNRISFLGLLIFAMFLVVGFGIVATNKNSSSPSPTPVANKVSYAQYTVVYGYWTSNSSKIKTLNLENGETSIIATLPSNIKHVKVLSPTTISYINNTNEDDHGTEIVVRNLVTSEDLKIVQATDGFGIDDYKISPNGKYLTLWEVQFAPGSKVLLGGKSRVLSLDLSVPRKTNVIADEVASPGVPVLYPLAISDIGEIVMDHFLPNDGAGWGYGISISNFTGSSVQQIDSMQNGTISTQPVASPNENRLVFSGYDGSKGPGTKVVGGFRRAQVNPNTVEIFDISSKTRQIIPRFQQAYTFKSSRWNQDTPSGLIVEAETKDQGTVTYDYNFQSGAAQVVPFKKDDGTSESVRAKLGQDKYLIVNQQDTNQSIVNLGDAYDLAITALSVYDAKSGEQRQVPLADPFIQFIGVKSGQYFKDIGLKDDGGRSDGVSKDQLQLASFALKPSLGPKRESQQSEVPQGLMCADLEAVICYEKLGIPVPDNPTHEQLNDIFWTLTDVQQQEFRICTPKNGSFLRNTSNRNLGACYDSPLYLYGRNGQDVNIISGVQISGSNISYSPSVGFDVQISNNSLISGEKSVESISFDYRPAFLPEKPKSGFVIKGKEIEKKAYEVSQELGLNDRETRDVKEYLLKFQDSPYIFLGIYDHETSNKILPLFFNPQPTTYRNIVFYVEKLNSFPLGHLSTPKIEGVQRNGFSAIEISYIVK